jgi:hypothetical protein
MPHSAPSHEAPATPRQALVTIGVIVGSIAFVAACVVVPRWVVESRIKPVTVAPPGDAMRFDPVQALSEVEAFVGGGVKLVSFDARMVRSDGTMDLKATYQPPPAADYVFTKIVSAPETAPPLGTMPASSTWQERITVKVSRPGQRFFVTSKEGGLTLKYNYVTKGMEKNVSDPAISPTPTLPSQPICLLSDLWRQAIQRGVPQDGVATITYNSRDYRFKQYGNVKTYTFGLDCKLVAK